MEMAPEAAEFGLIRKILLKEDEASLGTLEEGGSFVTAVNYLFKPGEEERLGDFYLFLSRLARHSKNIEKDPQVSLLVVERDPGVGLPERNRLTVTGRAEPVTSKQEEKLLGIQYVRQFLFSEVFFTLPDFRFYRLRPRTMHWIAGFGEIRNWEFGL